jgi:hypothetical protein
VSPVAGLATGSLWNRRRPEAGNGVPHHAQRAIPYRNGYRNEWEVAVNLCRRSRLGVVGA